MYNNTNPAEIYPNTTWELLASDKYLKTTTGTQFSTGGSNSFTIAKANLPAEKLQVDSFSLTRGTMDITGEFCDDITRSLSDNNKVKGAFISGSSFKTPNGASGKGYQGSGFSFQASRAWTGSTSSASPYTSAMGNGTPIIINPEHITVKAWKRLS